MIYLALFFAGTLGLLQLYGVSHIHFERQLTFLVASSVLFFGIRKIPLRFIQHLVTPFFVVTNILLLTVLFFGETIKGAQRWIQFGFFSLQPSEFAKLGITLMMAQFAHQNTRVNFRTWLKHIATWCVPVILVFLQPDFGSAMVLFAIISLGSLSLHIPRRYLLYLCLIVLLILPFLFVSLRDYQRLRIASFFFPQRVTADTNFNRIQSAITVGSGMIWGKGLGMGKQSKLEFLPEDRTDFAFASLSEQFGLVGAVMVIVLWGGVLVILVQRAYKSAQNGCRFGSVFLFCTFVQLLTQWFVNIGMNIGILPITGIPLPLISYGGSSVLVTFTALAIADNRAILICKPPRRVVY
jgi:rod shape determining protein RodA